MGEPLSMCVSFEGCLRMCTSGMGLGGKGAGRGVGECRGRGRGDRMRITSGDLTLTARHCEQLANA